MTRRWILATTEGDVTWYINATCLTILCTDMTESVYATSVLYSIFFSPFINEAEVVFLYTHHWASLIPVLMSDWRLSMFLNVASCVALDGWDEALVGVVLVIRCWDRKRREGSAGPFVRHRLDWTTPYLADYYIRRSISYEVVDISTRVS